MVYIEPALWSSLDLDKTLVKIISLLINAIAIILYGSLVLENGCMTKEVNYAVIAKKQYMVVNEL